MGSWFCAFLFLLGVAMTTASGPIDEITMGDDHISVSTALDPGSSRDSACAAGGQCWYRVGVTSMLEPQKGTTNVYGQHKDSPIVVGNLKSGYPYTVMVCRVNGNAQGPDWSVKNVCAIQFCHIGSGATVCSTRPSYY